MTFDAKRHARAPIERAAFTLVELPVVIAIITVLIQFERRVRW